jgi:hypothetical protein
LIRPWRDDHPRADFEERLKRHDDRLTFDRLLAATQWNRGEALYWRAWNDLRLDDIATATRDVNEAKRYLAGARVS